MFTATLLAAVIAAQDKSPDPTKLLQGKWDARTIKLADMPQEKAKAIRWTFQKNEMIAYEDGKETTRWTFTIDASKKPAQIDFSNVRDGKTQLLAIGIVGVDDESLTVAFIPALASPDGQPFARPKLLEASRENPCVCMTFQRAK